MIRTIVVCTAAILYLIVLGAPLLVYSYIRGNTNLIYRVGIICVRTMVWLAGVKVEVEGRDKIPPGSAVVFMPNHQSNADAPIIIVKLPPVLALVKKEFFRIPILGPAIRLVGFIPVDRQRRREQAVVAVEKAVGSIQAGRSFLAYPEGTRSPDGRLQAFKKGVFVMAIRTGAPIVPISISGATKIMRKGEFSLHSGVVQIVFHDPVLTEGAAPADLARIMEQVRRAILSGLTPEEWPFAAAAILKQEGAT